MSRFDRLLEQLRSYGPHVCIEADGSSYTYAQLLQETEKWQARLHDRGVAQVVGLAADYSVSAIAVLLALLIRRCTVALLPSRVDVRSYVADSHISALLDVNVAGDCVWRSVPNEKGHHLLEQLRAAGAAGLVVFTSGTTGEPKAALHSLERFLYKFSRPGRRFRTLAFMLLDHVAGLDTLFYTLSNGGTLIVPRRRDPRSILEIIASGHVEVLPTSPTFIRLLCSALPQNCDLSSLKIVTYGSEPMDATTLFRLQERFPGVTITQKYGTTEIGSPRSISRENDSLWIKIKPDGVQTKVVNGVLWVRSEGTVLGYLNAPSPLDEEGWYCTGDLVDVDGEWIRFLGRDDDRINVGGEKVMPTEVEQVILELDFVRDVTVLGEPHALMGQIVVARVVLKTTLPMKEVARSIRLHCRQRLAAHKVPVRVSIVSDLPNDRNKRHGARAPR